MAVASHKCDLLDTTMADAHLHTKIVQTLIEIEIECVDTIYSADYWIGRIMRPIFVHARFFVTYL